VIGLGDRALDSKVRVPWIWRTKAFTPRVIALQNRMRLTQSPRRAPCVHRLFAALAVWLDKTPFPVRQHPERVDPSL